MPRFAANLTMMFQEFEFLDRFQAAANAGFHWVEFLFPYEYPREVVASRLGAAGLKLALLNAPPGNWKQGDRGLAALLDRKEEFKQSIDTAIKYATALGSPLLHIMAGIADASDVKAQETYLQSIVYALNVAAPSKIGIVIEPLNRRDMPGYFLNNFDTAVELIKELGDPNLKLQFDIYHRQIIHGDVLTALNEMMPVIGHVQIASVPGRNEPNTGELDDVRILRALDKLGYLGCVGCEYRPLSRTVAGLAWREMV